MPMFTMSVIFFPVQPRQSPDRTASLNSRMWERTLRTPGMTSTPSTVTGLSDLFRSAVWRTARPSVKFILSPANIRSRHDATSDSRASDRRSDMVSVVIRCFE